ncbi:MAG TPA: F0F1 ATP synthase subunit delta, partial [Dictyoglomaceae bacterium]|nr:F0F1 ATP synthase subunit delta [Dictyoglomaceae bacterium]
IEQFIYDFNSALSKLPDILVDEIRFVSPDNIKPEAKSKIEGKLRELIPGKWKLSFEVDPEIGVGFKMFIGEFLIDHSLDFHLSQIYSTLREVENI